MKSRLRNITVGNKKYKWYVDKHWNLVVFDEDKKRHVIDTGDVDNILIDEPSITPKDVEYYIRNTLHL